MSENNLSYRIRTVVGTDNPDYVGNLNVLLDQDYDTFEIMSLKIKSSDTYRLHNSNNGVIAGRVIANNGFGIPNAKISLFIEADIFDNEELRNLYPYTTTATKNKDKVRYNLLPDNKVDECHQVVGTFPNKSYMLENDVLLEIYDKYYKYSTRTNNSGDYMLIGVPTGNHTLHMDLDLSDCGILSQRPRDFVYKGYTIEQFENPNKFKTGTNLDNLSQIFSQDLSVTVNPFWGNTELGNTVGITRADINVAFKFEPTCVFIGSVVSDNASNGISKKCVPTNQMGSMEDLTTGEGRIEMIRKTPGGDVEEFQIKGTQLIDGNGVWCYQIPMNLDYMRTDEYGNMVPTDDPEKGIATRTRVRFRVSMQDSELNKDNYFRAKVLVPNNPQNTKMGHEDYDYNFGTKTNETSYRDLFWNNVYTVKSYIPRFSRSQRWKNERFTGIKHCNIAGNNNPIPYNNIRIKLPLMFTLICVLIKCYVFMVGIMNYVISRIGNMLAKIGSFNLVYELANILEKITFWPINKLFKKLKELVNKPWARPFNFLLKSAKRMKLVTLKEGLCPDLDTWYFSPMKPMKRNLTIAGYDLMQQTLEFLQKDYEEGDEDDNQNTDSNTQPDTKSIDYQNGEWFNDDGESNDENEKICLTKNTDYLIACIEMALAQEYKVINFDFYNDWINGLLYIPRWVREVKKKRKYWIFGKRQTKVKGCMNDATIFGRTRKYMQLCSLPYQATKPNKEVITINKVYKRANSESQKFHKNKGKRKIKIFGNNGGIVHEATTIANQYVYYLKPCEWKGNGSLGRKVNLFATDIVLLGSLNNCDIYGVPQLFKYLPTSSYRMPTNLALTNMETEGPLYADDDYTKCTDSGIKEGIKEINGDQMTMKAEIEFYNGKNNDKCEDQDNYERLEYGNSEDDETNGNEGSDTIPTTEAAGIAWNYTGPGQGESSKKKKTLYMPGGHFLGISCINSQTNKKSCVNLERVCEIGASISQRHENVRKVSANEDGSAVEFKYVYNVPTGLIAEDEIIDTDARSMFATMNQRRLLATKTNPDTGYKYYDFIFRRPKGFGGEMENFVTDEVQYNTDVKVEDEDLTRFKIRLGKDNPDYDPEEPNNTQRRTIEDLNLDYYMFRMGFEYDDLKHDNFKCQKRKFLSWDGDTYYLPQYENSYYFYFGLKDGATALDEFNKQFFAACDSSSLIKRAKEITVTTEINVCENKGKIKVDIDNLEPEYSITLSKIENGVITTIYTATTEEDFWESRPLVMGTYKVEVVDSLDTYLEKTVTLSVDVNAKIELHHFNAYDRYEPKWWNGGYFSVSNLLVDGRGEDDIDFTVIVVGVGEKEYKGEALEFYVNNAGSYEIQVKYQCKGKDKEIGPVSLGTYEIFDTKKVHLYLGADNDIKIVGDGEEELHGQGNWWGVRWWTNLDSAVTSNEKKWALKHYLFAQNDVNEGTEGFDSNIKTDVSRGLFGEAQRQQPKPYFTGKANKQGDDTGEYTLTDKSGYWQTLDQKGQNARPYGTMAYDGSVVGGEYCGYIENGNVIWNGKKTIEPSTAIGVLAKNKDTNEITYATVNNGNVEFNDRDYMNDSWVLFPLFRYPSIYRPFYATMFFFAHSDKTVNVISDTNSNLSPTIEFVNDNSRLIGDIYNGITFNNEWGGMSVCGLPVESRLSGMTIDDKDGIDERIAKFANTANRPQRVGLKDEEMVSPWIMESGVDEYSYELNEGTPAAKVNRAAQIEDTLSAAFWDNVTYAANNGIGKFYGIGDAEDTEDEVTYYIIPKGYIVGESNLLIDGNAQSNGEKKPLLYEDENLLYVLGKYNENAPLDQLGGTVFVEINGTKAKFSKTGENGKVIETIDVDSVESIIANPGMLMANSYQDFYDKGVILQAVCPTLVYENKEAWANLYKIVKAGEEAMLGQYNCRIAKVDGKHFQVFNPETETIIGIYRKNSGCWGRSGIIMLYPYFEKSSQYKLDGNEPYIIVSPNPLTFPRDGGARTITVTSNVDWVIDESTIPSWVEIGSSMLSGKAGVTSVELIIDSKNNSDGNIRFYAPEYEDVDDILKVTQKTGGGSDPDQPVTESKIITNRSLSDTFIATSGPNVVTVAPSSSETLNVVSGQTIIFKVKMYQRPWYVYGVDVSGTNVYIGKIEEANKSIEVSYNDSKLYNGFILTNEYLDKKTVTISNNSSQLLTIKRTSGEDAEDETTFGAGAQNIPYVIYGNNVLLFECNEPSWDLYGDNSYLNHGTNAQGISARYNELSNYAKIEIRAN